MRDVRLHRFFSDQTEQGPGQRKRSRPDKKPYDAKRLNTSQQRKEDMRAGITTITTPNHDPMTYKFAAEIKAKQAPDAMTPVNLAAKLFSA
jgi:hypothetical protein